MGWGGGGVRTPLLDPPSCCNKHCVASDPIPPEQCLIHTKVFHLQPSGQQIIQIVDFTSPSNQQRFESVHPDLLNGILSNDTKTLINVSNLYVSHIVYYSTTIAGLTPHCTPTPCEWVM